MNSPHPHKARTGLDRVRHAFGYSLQGLFAALRFESAFRQEAALAAVMLPAAFWIGRDWVEVALLTGSVLLVMLIELLNSAIEAVVDRVSLEMHELAKRAKDYGSAAVLIALLWCGGIWAAVIYQRWMA